MKLFNEMSNDLPPVSYFMQNLIENMVSDLRSRLMYKIREAYRFLKNVILPDSKSDKYPVI